MSVEFDSVSRDERPEEHLAAPVRFRRRWIIAACAGAAVVVLGGGAVAWAQSSPSSSGSGSASAKPTGYASHGAGGPGGSGGGHGFAGGPGGPNHSGTRTAPKPQLLGTVKSVSGTKILITDFEGFTRTIVTSSKTVYKDGLTASPKAGTKLDAEGTVDADGTSLDATLVQAPHLFGGPGGMHRNGPGVRPSGAPTGAKPTGVPTGHYRPGTGTHPGAPSSTPPSTTTSS
jgi:hypothetical protein